jgi:hypothetical protein
MFWKPWFQLFLCELSSSQSQSHVTTDGQSVNLSWCQAPIWGSRPYFYCCQTVAGLLMCGALSDERTGLPFTIAAGPRQRSHFWVRVPGLVTIFYCLRFETPPTWRARCRIYIPQEQGGPVIPPGTGFPFRRLLRFVGQCWRYSKPPLRR